MEPREVEGCPEWDPSKIYYWTTEELKKWLDQYGTWAMHGGKTWEPGAIRLPLNLWEVKFREYEQHT